MSVGYTFKLSSQSSQHNQGQTCYYPRLAPNLSNIPPSSQLPELEIRIPSDCFPQLQPHLPTILTKQKEQLLPTPLPVWLGLPSQRKVGTKGV